MGEAIYCDHNFIIALSEASSGYQAGICQLASDGRVTFVLSLWTIVEIARARSPANLASIAAAADSVEPQWIPERRLLQRQEVAEQFFRYLGVSYARPAIFRSLAEVAAELAQHPVPIGQRYSVVEFARTIRANMAPIERAYTENKDARNVIAMEIKRGSPRPNRDLILRKYVKTLLPDKTPADIQIASSVKQSFLDQIVTGMFPSIAVEHAIFEDWMGTAGGQQINSFLDRQHLIAALPYVRRVISDDDSLARTVKRFAPTLPFSTAQVATKQEFDDLYLTR